MEVCRSLFNSSTYFPDHPNGHYVTPILQEKIIPAILGNTPIEAPVIPTNIPITTDNNTNQPQINTDPDNTKNNHNTLEHANKDNNQTNDTDNINRTNAVTPNHTTSPDNTNGENPPNPPLPNSINTDNVIPTNSVNPFNSTAHHLNLNNGQTIPSP
jgi:hypothetical protein